MPEALPIMMFVMMPTGGGARGGVRDGVLSSVNETVKNPAEISQLLANDCFVAYMF